MSIFGIGSSELGSFQSDIHCVSCGQSGYVKVSVEGKYFHLVFLPAFPLGRKVSSRCANCNHSLSRSQFPAAYEHAYRQMAKQFKRPKWHYSWIFIWVVVTPFVIMCERRNKGEDKALIAAAKPGDLYEVKLGFRSFTLYKVARVNKDSIYFYPNKFEVNKERMLDEDKMLDPENFDTENSFGMTRKEVLQQRESGKIRDIIRN